MTHGPPPPEGWDRLVEPSVAKDLSAQAPTRTANPRPGPLLLVAGALGDLVSLVSPCAASLVAVRALGHRTPLSTFSWAAALAIVWWCAAAAALVVVRRGTPGMLMAGYGFARSVAPRRVVAVLAAALATAFTLGLPVAVGAAAPLLRIAGGAELRLVDS